MTFRKWINICYRYANEIYGSHDVVLANDDRFRTLYEECATVEKAVKQIGAASGLKPVKA